MIRIHSIPKTYNQTNVLCVKQTTFPALPFAPNFYLKNVIVDEVEVMINLLTEIH